MRNRKLGLALLLCLLLCLCLIPAAYADGSTVQELQAAIDSKAESFTLTGDLTIPAGTTVDASNTQIIVPLGKTLTVAGKLTIGDLDIMQNPPSNQRGVLAIADGGELHVTKWIDLSNNIWTNWRQNGADSRVTFEDNAGFRLQRGMLSNVDGITYAIRDAADNNIAQNEHLRLCAFTPASLTGWEISEDTTIPAHLILDVSNTALTVPLGKTLTVAGKLNIGDLDIMQNPQLEQRGVLAIADGGELHVTKWIDLSNNIWTNWRGSGESNRVTFDDNAGFRLQRGMLSNVDGITYAIRDAADNNIAQNEHLRLCAFTPASLTEWAISEDTTIPAHLILDVSNTALTVPLGKTLTVAGKLTIGDLNIEQNPQLEQRGVLAISDGGELHVTKWIDLSNNIWTNWRQNGADSRVTFEDNAGFILHRGDIGADNQGHTAAEVFKFTLSDGNNILTQAPGHLKFDFALKAGEFVDLRDDDEPVTIPEGFVFAVKGTLLTGGFSDYGTVTVADGGFLYAEHAFTVGPNVQSGMFQLNGELSIEHDADFNPNQLAVITYGENGLLDISFNMETEAALLEELNAPMADFGNHFRRTIWLMFGWEPDDDLTLPAHLRLYVDGSSGGELTIHADRALTIPASSSLCARDGAAIILNGSLENNGEINLGPAGREGELGIGTNASYSGSGSITRGGEPYTITISTDSEIYAALLKACEQTYNEVTEYDILGEHSFTVPASDGLFIPENLRVYALDSTFTVSDTSSLIVRDGGQLIAGGLDSEGITEVDGSLHLERTLRIGSNPLELNGDMVITLDAWSDLWDFIDAKTPDDVAAKFSFGSDSLLDIWYEPTDTQNVSDTLDFPMFHIPHICETICLLFPWTLDHDRALDADRSLLMHYGNGATGMLTIPEGMTLTISQGAELFPRGAQENGEAILQVNGTLINEGNLHFHRTRAGLGDIALGSKGIYCGSGTIQRVDEPYTIYNNKSAADLVLPEDLATLESEALADGDFRSVYIPANAVVVPDAFGSKTGLIILAVPGSTAATSAASAGFLLAPVE